MLETSDSRKLLQQFKNGGSAFLKSLKDRKASESEILDFKLAKSGEPPLETEDKANLARAISGFANTKGGVLIWGVYCAKDETGEDCVQSFNPITRVSAFKSEVQAILCHLSAPAVQGIELFCIFEDDHDSSGYLIMHVPKSTALIESLFKKNKGFYERAGTSFVEMADSRLVAKAKHVPFGKRLVPYMRAFGVYIAMLLVFVVGCFLGIRVTEDVAYKRGLAAGRQEAKEEKSREASGERTPAAQRYVP